MSFRCGDSLLLPIPTQGVAAERNSAGKFRGFFFSNRVREPMLICKKTRSCWVAGERRLSGECGAGCAVRHRQAQSRYAQAGCSGSLVSLILRGCLPAAAIPLSLRENFRQRAEPEKIPQLAGSKELAPGRATTSAKHRYGTPVPHRGNRGKNPLTFQLAIGG